MKWFALSFREKSKVLDMLSAIYDTLYRKKQRIASGCFVVLEKYIKDGNIEKSTIMKKLMMCVNPSSKFSEAILMKKRKGLLEFHIQAITRDKLHPRTKTIVEEKVIEADSLRQLLDMSRSAFGLCKGLLVEHNKQIGYVFEKLDSEVDAVWETELRILAPEPVYYTGDRMRFINRRRTVIKIARDRRDFNYEEDHGEE